MYSAVLLVLLLAAVRLTTGVTELTSPGTIAAAVTLTVPIAIAGLGGLWAERAGVVNIGLEGMLILGTFGAGWAGYQSGPWVGVLAAVAFGAIGGLLLAVATVTFSAGHIVSGVAINILALGATQFLAAELLQDAPGGGPRNSPPVEPIGSVTVPWVSGAARDVASEGIFLVSDLAGIVAGITANLSYLTLLAVLLFVASAFVLWRTPFGLRLRSCGEAPYAAATVGVNVIRYKFTAVVMSGALAGFGGAFLALVASNAYRDGQTGGRGFIGLAAMIFGNWRPGGLAGCAGVFGYADALQLRSAQAVHALLLLTAVVIAGYGLWRLYRREPVAATISLMAALGLAAWFLGTDELPPQVTFATPYVATLLVLALHSQDLRMPAADGLPYLRSQPP